MIYVKPRYGRVSPASYDPIKKELVYKKKRGKSTARRLRKKRTGLIGVFPGYIFYLNKVKYVCVMPPAGGPIPDPDNPIPVEIYPMPPTNRRIPTNWVY